METRIMDEERPITVRDLYPHLSPEEIKAVEEAFDRYLLAVYEILQSSEAKNGGQFDSK